MYNKVIKISGKQKGPTSIILTGVHGNERCGLKAFNKILPNLKIKKGKVLFLYANPKALEKNKRFIEYDLNRLFIDTKILTAKQKKSYEFKRVQLLKKYCNQSDVLLDIHASSNPKSQPFVICEKNARDIAKYFPINLIVSGFDKVEPGGTDYYMNKIKKIGITLECGYLGDLKSVDVAKKGIISFLKARGHIINDLKINKKQSDIKMYKKYFSKSNNFILSKDFKDFEVLRKGQVIGKDGKKEIRSPKKSIILFAHNCKNIGQEAFLLGEKRSP